jgi:TP901 family phage tail tape measure protein
MARTSATISIGADTRQLERDIQNALSRDFKFKGLNEKNFTQPLGRITGAADEFQKSLDASNARVIAFGASAGLIYAVQKAFTDLIRTTVDVQKSLTDINVILNTTTQGLARFGAEVFNIAKDTGQSFRSVAEAATELARQGLGAEETLKRTRDALILTRLSGLDTVNAVEALTATINSFSKSALDSTAIINKLANVDAAFAVSSADLAEAIKRVGSSAQDVNVDFDQLLAIVTSVQQTTARGGAVIGNSLKTIFTRIQRPEVLDQLQSLGITVRDLEGNTLPALQILKELGATFDTLRDSQRAQVAESVGGVFQINVLKAALGDLGKEYSIYDRALKTSMSSTDEAIRRNEALNETIAALFNRTIANTAQLSTTIGSGAFQPAIENVLKSVNKVLDFVNSQDGESIGGRLGEGILKGLSTFVSGPGIVLITAVIGKLALNLSKFAASGFKDLLGINQQAQARAQLQTKINQVLSQEPQLLAAINAKQVTVLSVENQILKILKEQNALRSQAAALSSTISSSLVARGVAVKSGQITTKSSGFIPNYAMSEIYGALAGGYKPGKIREMNLSGEGKIIYNSAEKVKKFPGMSQPAIMPPSKSKAGKEYRKNFIAQNSFDPYASQGFIPNFNLTAIRSELPMNSIKEQMMFRKYLRQGYEVLGGELYERANLASNATLYNDKSLIRAAGQILVKSNKKSIIVKQLREKELATAQGKGAREAAKIRSKLVYVYPDAAGGAPPFFVGGTSKTGESYKFTAFPFPGGGEKIPDELYNNISNSLVQNAKDYISQVSTRPQLVDQKIFEQYIKSNLSRSAVEAATGQVFEASVKAAIKRVTTSEISNFDLDRGELLAISKRFKSAGPLKDFTAGDFKNSLSDSNLDSFADKIATKEGKTKAKKTKSAGFIPNFSALGSSIKRELAAGVPVSKIRVGQDNRLMSPKNPLGIGVYNTDDEPNGIKQGIAAQKNINVAKKAGSFSEGFIPNFAGQGPFIGLNPAAMTNLTNVLGSTDAGAYARDEIQKAKAEFNKIINELRNQQRSLKSANKEVDQLKLKYNLSNQSVTNMNRSLQEVANATRSFNKNVSNLERSAGGFLGLGIGGGRQLRELERIRDTTTGERAQRASEALGRAQQARQVGAQRIQTAGIGLSIGAPIIAQTIAASRPGDQKAQAAAEGLGTFASFAGAGALFGPFGIAIGATVGAVLGFKKSLEILNDKTAEFAKQAAQSLNNLSRFNENVQGFLTFRDQIRGLQTGEIKGTNKDLQRAERESRASLGRVLNDVGPELRNQIINAVESGDEERLREALGRASTIKESAKSIDEFASNIAKLKKDGNLKDTFDENITAFGMLRTRSGETFAELFSNNEKLIGSLSGYANAVELVSFTTSKGIKDLEKSLTDRPLFGEVRDPFGFTNLTNIQNGPKSVMETGMSPFPQEQIDKKIKQMDIAYVEAITRSSQGFGGVFEKYGVPKNYAKLTQEEKENFAIQKLSSDLAAESLKNFNTELNNFVGDLVTTGEITEKNSESIKKSIKNILEGEGDPKEKITKVIEKFKELGGSIELAGIAMDNAAKGIFSFAKLSVNLTELFAQGDGTEGGDAKAKARRLAGAKILKQSNFAELFKDPELVTQYSPKTILENLTKSATTKIVEGTQEDSKRINLMTEFSNEIKIASDMLAKEGKLTDEQLAKLSVGLDKAGQKASISGENLKFLEASISDATLKQEAINKYKAIEADLTQKLNGNVNLLIPALSNAAKSLSIIQQARRGEIFLEEKNSQLIKDSIDAIRSNRFEGLDIEELTRKSASDYQKEIADSTLQGINSINENTLDDQTRTLAKERLKALEQEQLNLIKSQGSLSVRQVSEFESKLKALTASNSSLKNGFDTLNTSILDSTLRQGAANKLEIIRTDLEKKYGDNLVKLDLATQAAADNLSLFAQSAEGAIFSDEFLSGRQAIREKNIKLGNTKPMDFLEAFTDTFDYNTSTLFRDVQLGAIDTARTIKSEFNNAFLSFANGTATASDAFRKMALNISDKIQQLALEFTTNLAFGQLFGSTSAFGGAGIFGNLFGKSKGGIIKGYSSGGTVTGGSGTKDDVPAMLSAGEYVIRKSAVKKYGPEYLQMLNQGRVEKKFLGGITQQITAAHGTAMAYGMMAASGAVSRENAYRMYKERKAINAQNSKFPSLHTSSFGDGMFNAIADRSSTFAPVFKSSNQPTSTTFGYSALSPRRKDDEQYFKHGGRVQKFLIGGPIKTAMAGLIAAGKVTAATSNPTDSSTTPTTATNYGTAGAFGSNVARLSRTVLKSQGLLSYNQSDTSLSNMYFKNGGRVQKFATGGELNYVAKNTFKVKDFDPIYIEETGQTLYRPKNGKLSAESDLNLRALLDSSNPQNELRKQMEQIYIDRINKIDDYLEYVDGVREANKKSYEENQRINKEIRDQYNRQKKQAITAGLIQAGIGLAGIGLSFLPGAGTEGGIFGNLFGSQSKYGPSAKLGASSAVRSNYLSSAPLRYSMPTPRAPMPRAMGGYIKKFADGGQNYKDNIPALLMGGEFVMRKEAVNLYGKKFFDELNSGRIKKFAEGGSASGQIGFSSNNQNAPINNVNVTVNLTQGQTMMESKQEKSGSELNEMSEKDKANMLGQRIKSQVIQTILEQQRPGGLLSSQMYKKRQ